MQHHIHVTPYYVAPLTECYDHWGEAPHYSDSAGANAK